MITITSIIKLQHLVKMWAFN